jgi:hypothetical protein
VKVNGSPADSYNFKPAAATISYSLEYECEAARVFANIPIAEWTVMPGTREWIPPTGGRCKCDILILYRMSNFIPAVSNDAQAREMERQSKRRRH